MTNPAPPGAGSRQAVPAFAAAIIAAAVELTYWLLIIRQGPIIGLPRVLFFSAYIGGLAAVSFIGARASRSNDRLAKPLLVGAGAGCLACGGLAAGSIGLPLILAGVLALLGMGTRPIPRFELAIALLSPIAILAAGLLFT